MKTSIDQKTLKECLDYDPKTGVFTWKVSPAPQIRAGRTAGGLDDEGYVRIKIAGVKYRASRLAWLWMTGAQPLVEIDHRNGARSDNKWKNLREATRRFNRQNLRRAYRNSATGLLGVTRNHKNFMAQIQLDGERRCLGTFPDAESAHAAYLKAKRELHPGCTI